MSLDFNHLVDEGFHDSDSHLVVRCLLLVVDRNQIQMDNQEHSLDLQLVDDLLKNLAQLQKTLDDETR